VQTKNYASNINISLPTDHRTLNALTAGIHVVTATETLALPESKT